MSVFVTGPAGTGKTVLLKEMVKHLQKLYGGKDKVAVTASTALASQSLDGCTFHSFFGFSQHALALRDRSVTMETLANSILKVQPLLRLKLMQTKVLLLDEVSMLHPYYFELAERISKSSRNCLEPWGGLQLILCGDFLQLPPVVPKDIFCADFDDSVTAIYLSKSLSLSLHKVVKLEKIYRQTSVDEQLVLNRIRMGSHTPEDFELILKLVSGTAKTELQKGVNEVCTVAFATRAKVDKYNSSVLDMMKDKEERSYAIVYDSQQSHLDTTKALLKDDMGCEFSGTTHEPLPVVLKIGCRVMVDKNMTNLGLANGNRGTIVGFKQAPPTFATGSLRSGNRPWRYYGTLEYPEVSFDHDPENIKLIPMCQYTRPVYGANEPTDTFAWRIGVRPAFSMTIHKMQGQTVHANLVVDVSDCFATGHVYTALSRPTAFEHLKLLSRFGFDRILTDCNAVKFYQEEFVSTRALPVPETQDLGASEKGNFS